MMTVSAVTGWRSRLVSSESLTVRRAHAIMPGLGSTDADEAP